MWPLLQKVTILALSKGVWGHVALTSAIDNVSDGTQYLSQESLGHYVAITSAIDNVIDGSIYSEPREFGTLCGHYFSN